MQFLHHEMEKTNQDISRTYFSIEFEKMLGFHRGLILSKVLGKIQKENIN